MNDVAEFCAMTNTTVTSILTCNCVSLMQGQPGRGKKERQMPKPVNIPKAAGIGPAMVASHHGNQPLSG